MGESTSTRLARRPERGDPAFSMPWGQKATGEGYCDIIGKQRTLKRADISTYRSWPFAKFMLTMTPSVFSLVWPWTVTYILLAIATCLVHRYSFDTTFPNKDMLALFTTPTAFLLLFRCNMGYARFWEGRGHFGVFNFALREVTRRCYTFIRGADVHDEGAVIVRHNVIRLLMVMAMSVKFNLRSRSMGEGATEEGLELVRQFLTVKEFDIYTRIPKDRPVLVMSWIGKWVHQGYLDGYLPQKQMLMSFDRNVSDLLRGWMGMHKVSYQPIPFPYIQTLHWFLFIWMILANFTLQESFGDDVSFVIVMAFSATALYSLEEMAAEIEDPFGDDLNDLATEVFENGLRRDGLLALSGYGALDQHFPHDIDPETIKLPMEERDPNFIHGQLRFTNDMSASQFDLRGGLAGFVAQRAKKKVMEASPTSIQQAGERLTTLRSPRLRSFLTKENNGSPGEEPTGVKSISQTTVESPTSHQHQPSTGRGMGGSSNSLDELGYRPKSSAVNAKASDHRK